MTTATPGTPSTPANTSHAAPPQGPVAPAGPPAPLDAPPPALTPEQLTARRYITAALLLSMVLASMEMTVTSTAMPTIIARLHGLEHYSWVASMYLLASTITMPIYGRLADVIGRKRAVLIAIAIFSVGSVLSGCAQTMIQLIVFRGIQGLGAGGIMPVVLTILADVYTLKERASIQAWFSALWGVSALAGPALGAFLVKYVGWRSIFYINLPFGVMAAAVLLQKYREHEKPQHTDLDLIGAGTLSAGCMALLLLLSRLGPGGWSVSFDVLLAVLAVGFLAYFIWHELRTPNALMPPRLLAQRAIGPSLLGNLVLGAAYLGMDTYVPLYVQGGRGGDASAAAWVVTPVLLTWAISGLAAAPMVVSVGFRKTAMLGSFFIAAGFGGLLATAWFNANTLYITAALAVAGLGMGPCSMAYLLAAQDVVPWQQRGSVTGSVTFCRTIGGALGIGILGTIFNALMQDDLTRLKAMGISPSKALDPSLHGDLPHDVLVGLQHAFAGSLTWVFVVMVACTLIQILVTLMMLKHEGTHQVTRAEMMEAMGG